MRKTQWILVLLFGSQAMADVAYKDKGDHYTLRDDIVACRWSDQEPMRSELVEKKKIKGSNVSYNAIAPNSKSVVYRIGKSLTRIEFPLMSKPEFSKYEVPSYENGRVVMAHSRVGDGFSENGSSRIDRGVDEQGKIFGFDSAVRAVDLNNMTAAWYQLDLSGKEYSRLGAKLSRDTAIECTSNVQEARDWILSLDVSEKTERKYDDFFLHQGRR